MLVVESLHRPWDIVVRADSLLHVLAVVDVAPFDLVVLLLVANGGQAKCEYRLGLL